MLVDGSLSRWFRMTWAIDKVILYSLTTFLAFLEHIMDGVNEVEGKGIIIQVHSDHNLRQRQRERERFCIRTDVTCCVGRQ